MVLSLYQKEIIVYMATSLNKIRSLANCESRPLVAEGLIEKAEPFSIGLGSIGRQEKEELRVYVWKLTPKGKAEAKRLMEVQ